MSSIPVLSGPNLNVFSYGEAGGGRTHKEITLARLKVWYRSHFGVCPILVPRVRFELTTSGLRVRCATTALPRVVVINWFYVPTLTNTGSRLTLTFSRFASFHCRSPLNIKKLVPPPRIEQGSDALQAPAMTTSAKAANKTGCIFTG